MEYMSEAIQDSDSYNHELLDYNYQTSQVEGYNPMDDNYNLHLVEGYQLEWDNSNDYKIDLVDSYDPQVDVVNYQSNQVEVDTQNVLQKSTDYFCPVDDIKQCIANYNERQRQEEILYEQRERQKEEQERQNIINNRRYLEQLEEENIKQKKLNAIESLQNFNYNKATDGRLTLEVPLRQIYSRFQRKKIFYMYGFDPDIDIDFLHENAMHTFNMTGYGSSHFLSGNNMFGYIHRNLDTSTCNNWITFVIPDLRTIYLRNIEQLDDTKRELLLESVDTNPPTFHNASSIKGNIELSRMFNYFEYQLLGEITPFDVLHITAKDFVYCINHKIPLKFILNDLQIIITLTYIEEDFWDTQYQENLTYSHKLEDIIEQC